MEWETYSSLGYCQNSKGFYRRDYSKHMAFDGSEDNEIDAIVLSHAHIDHCAYIHYVRPDIPIYCSEETKLIMRGFEDTGSNEDYIIFIQISLEIQTLKCHMKNSKHLVFLKDGLYYD